MITAKWDRFYQNQVRKTPKDTERRIKFINKTIDLLHQAIKENRSIGNPSSLREAAKQQDKLKQLQHELITLY